MPLEVPPAASEVSEIARCNLLCAEGLNGAEKINIDECLRRLDQIAQHVSQETKRHWYRFVQNRGEYNNSEGVFRCIVLATVMQEDFGIHYNPERVTEVEVFEPNEGFYGDSRDVFIHGLLSDRAAGTCASSPVLYAAVGRRLGYPLNLVTTKNHLFVRWDGPTERFNFDATGKGLSLFDDDHYRNWPFPVSAEEEKACGYLKSLNSTEERALFLNIRGHCLMASGRSSEAVQAHAEAAKLVPANRLYQQTLSIVQREAASLAQSQVQQDITQLENAAERAIATSRSRRGD